MKKEKKIKLPKNKVRLFTIPNDEIHNGIDVNKFERELKSAKEKLKRNYPNSELKVVIGNDTILDETEEWAIDLVAIIEK